MRNTYDTRTIEIASYISKTGKTVRDAAANFGISKSTVHKDITVRLPEIDTDLFDKVRKILDINKAERHLRGGLATKEKYMEKRRRLY